MERKEYALTKEECLRIGGHCYEPSDYVVDTNPPTYHRVCKHCGYVQEGHPQPVMSWADDKVAFTPNRLEPGMRFFKE